MSGTRRSSASISANDELGDRDRVLARTVRHVDSAASTRRDIDGVDARSGANDQRQLPGVEHRSSTCVERTTSTCAPLEASAAASVVVFEIRLVDDIAPERLQAVDAGLFELVCDENLHVIPFDRPTCSLPYLPYLPYLPSK